MRHLILLLPIALAACATTGSGGTAIAVDTASRGQALTGASCIVQTGAGSWNITTPATVDVGAPSGDLRIVCNRPGYRTSETLYRPSRPLGSNVGLGAGGGSGHVGVGVGLSFPISVGGGRYPSSVTVEMNPE